LPEERRLAFVPGLKPLRDPDQPPEEIRLAEPGGHLVLQGHDRQFGCLRDQPEVLIHEVDGHVRPFEAGVDDRDDLAGDEWKRLPGQDLMPEFDQFAPQLVSLRLEVRCGCGQEHCFAVGAA
jgi:hypothetical protein